MPRVFYTETDIRAMVARGVLVLEIHDNIMLTDLAHEKARHLGMRLVRNPSENTPVAPTPGGAVPQIPNTPMEKTTLGADAPHPATTDLAQRIRSAVATHLGNQLDPSLLDTIIQRVLISTGVK